MLTREELVAAVLEMFKLQRIYFSTRSQAALEQSKAAERSLKHECLRILEGPTLFGDEDRS